VIVFILHLDQHLRDLLLSLGPWIYVLLFAVIFCETGLVVTPFLPGDSLLFALGAIAAAQPEHLMISRLAMILPLAAIGGDNLNYVIGRHAGPTVFRRDTGWFLNRNHLIATQKFYERHGGKTIFLAKFLPIIRTFAPFVAGVGRMAYRRFALFNISSGICWVLSLLAAGYFFGNIPIVKHHFEMVILGIIVASTAPFILRVLHLKLRSKKNAGGG